MKTLKCPLCGFPFEYYEEGYYCFCQCSACLLACEGAQTRADAWKNVERLISKFPPIMRVWPGDEVLCGSRPSPVTIVSKNIECGEIKIRDCHRTYFIIDCDDVLAWPWDFEQEGGDA